MKEKSLIDPALIVPGALLVTRDGAKARIYAIDHAGSQPICGAFMMTNGSWIGATWKENGQWCLDGDKMLPSDLVGPWIEKPLVNWADMPRWAKAVARDSIGGWFHYSGKPDLTPTSWQVFRGIAGAIPDSHAPQFSGDWKDSLVIRPEGV